MSQEPRPDEIAKKTVVYQVPGMDAVTVRRDVKYGQAGDDTLRMDIYYPPDLQNGARLPAVVIVAGYPDAGFQKHLGCKFKEMGSTVSWGQLIAASGMATITYTNREPAADLDALLQFVRQNTAELGIDENRLGLWASSGNAPLALSVLMREADDLNCAVLCYPYTLDIDATAVSDAAKMFGFVNPNAGKTIDELPLNLPLYIARAGQDECPGLNETLDRFLFKALTRNLPVTFVNHAEAPHAFDLFHDSEATRAIIRQTLTFMRFHLLPAA